MLCCTVPRRSERDPSKDPSFARLESADDASVPPRMPPLVLVAFVFPALAGLNFGFDIGSTGGAVQSLRAVPATGLDDSPLLVGLLTSGSLFGAVVGTTLSFVLAAPLGRRGELLLASGLYALGTATCVAAPDGPDLLGWVFAGRGIYGVGIAFAMHAAPVYIAEMSPPHCRGLLVSLKEGFIVLGILCGFSASALATAWQLEHDVAWRFIWAAPALFAVIVGIGMWSMPPSPRWLLLRALDAPPDVAQRCTLAAHASLRRLRSHTLCAPLVCDEDACAAEISSIQRTLSEVSGNDDGKCDGRDSEGGRSSGGGRSGGGCAELLQARRALIAGLGLVLLQQVTGQPSVLYYQESIFRDAGFGDVAPYASVIVGGTKLLATLFTVLKVEDYGRRPLLFAGITMMLTSLVALAVAFHQRPQPPPAPLHFLHLGAPPPPTTNLASVVIVAALMVYVCGYQVGFGPIAWLMISEVFPLKMRATALSMAVTVNFGFNLLATFTLPSIQHAFDLIEPGKGIAWLFALYAILCVVSLVFTAVYVPETKGKSLEQIEEELCDRPSDRPNSDRRG